MSCVRESDSFPILLRRVQGVRRASRNPAVDAFMIGIQSNRIYSLHNSMIWSEFAGSPEL